MAHYGLTGIIGPFDEDVRPQNFYQGQRSIFEEDTPLSLIKVLRPDVLVKGADYAREAVVGHELVEGWGGRVVLTPLIENLSTTGIVERVKGTNKA